MEEETIDLVEDEGSENAGVPGAALQDAEKNDNQVPEDEFGAKDYRSLLQFSVVFFCSSVRPA